MKLERIVFPLWQLLPTLLLLSAIMFTEGNPQRSTPRKEAAVRFRRKGFSDDFKATRIRKKRQLLDGFNFQFGNVLTRAMEGLDTMLKSTQNFDVFNCLQRISCEITAPLNSESGRQLRREFLGDETDEVDSSPTVESEELAPKEQDNTPSSTPSVAPVEGFPHPYPFAHIPIHPLSLPYYYPWIYGLHPFQVGANFSAGHVPANYSSHNMFNHAFPYYSLPAPHFPYHHPHLIPTATPHLTGTKSTQHFPQVANNDIEDLDTQNHETTKQPHSQVTQSFPTLINPRNGANQQNQGKESYIGTLGNASPSQGNRVTLHSSYQSYGNEDNTQNYGSGNHYQKPQYQVNEASYQSRGIVANYHNPQYQADYQNRGTWDNYQYSGPAGDSSTASIQRIGHDSQEEGSPSWFSGYRRAIRAFKNRRNSRRRNQDDSNWFKRIFGRRRRRRRSSDDSHPSIEEFKRRVRRGIMDTLSKAAESGKEFMGTLERMMQGSSGSSLYPLTQAALMGYVGTPKTCEQMYPTCPTSSDEMIQVFNNLNRYFPNGIPFRDRIPRPLRFFIP